ncbi:MAG: RagB/SusD family nutrient uptake outer membrane protein [Bacteroidales bacterium]|nr:RagB/SusD family nutrient uptake outer membrane protein [Bacteroidales bacterium]MBQ8810965.1 RagB/SusD family nutrient uptake outer membrane protein [Bacteroidales bacterium]
MKSIKNILYVALGAGLMLASASCSDFFEVESPSSSDAPNVFSDYTLSEYAVFSICHTFGETNNYRGRFHPHYGYNTDIEWYNGENDAYLDLCRYDAQLNNKDLSLANGPYNMMYSAIEKANLVIEGLREYGNVETNADMAYLLGETLTLRALIYHDLIKGWGDVPARFAPISAETLYLPKSDRDVVYKQILADLEESFDYLYWPGASSQTAKVDRINLAFAKALYARIALAASGYAQRPDDGLVGTGNAGSVRLSSDPELSKDVLYPKALAALEDVITSNTCSLRSSFRDLWYDVNNFDLQAGREILYCIPFSDTRGRWNFYFAGKSENSSYSNGASSGGYAGPVPTHYFNYESEDTRRDVSCVNFLWNKNDMLELSGPSCWYFGKFRYEWMVAHPYTGGNDDGIKPVYMRYADVLLMAAEIANELNQLDKAKQYFLQVRKRAYAGNEAMAEAYVNAIGGKDAMFDAIVDERALEFVGEFVRKGDLIRWNLLKTKLDEAKADLTDFRNHTGAFAHMTEGDIYYKEAEDGMSLVYWGYAPEEAGAPAGADWILEKGYVDTKEFEEKKFDRVETIYLKDPDTRQFWPIFEASLANSQGSLVNDYGY